MVLAADDLARDHAGGTRVGGAAGTAETRPGFAPYAGPILRGGEAAIPIRVPVTGVKDLYLLVTGEPTVVRGAATWADARLIAADGSSVRACHLPGIAYLEGQHAMDVNLKSGFSGPLAIAGRRFEHGIHVYADSKIRLPLSGKFHWFEAWIGIDDWAGTGGAVRFDVTDAAGAVRHDLWSLVARDFSDAASRKR